MKIVWTEPLKIARAAAIGVLIAALCFGAMQLADNTVFKIEPVDAESKPVNGFIKEPEIELSGLNTAEVGSSLLVGDLVFGVRNGTLINSSEALNTSVLGDNIALIKIARTDGSIASFEARYTVKDTTPPVIVIAQNPKVRKGREIDLLSAVSVVDNSGENIKVNVSGEYSFDVEGEYNITYSCADSSGNSAEASAVLSVYTLPIAHSETAVKTPDTITTSTYSLPYAVTVYREYGMIVIWAPDESGHFTVPVRECIASAGIGNNTPLGTFSTLKSYDWQKLDNEDYVQYSTKIADGIFLQSVPYRSRDKATLKHSLFNNLGEKETLGSIRLTAADAKWIYDNCPIGTAVTVTTDPLPIGINRPDLPILKADDPNCGWDPTDPSPGNPCLSVG